MKSDVAAGYDVRPQHCHQQINIARPFADAFQLDEFGFDRGIGQTVQGVEVDVLIEHSLGQMTGVGGLLPAESDRFQIGVVDRQYPFRRYLAKVGREFIKTRLCRGQRNLLLKDDLKKGRIPRRPCPKRRCAVRSVNMSECLVTGREFAAYRGHIAFADSYDFCHYAITIAAKQCMSIIPKLATSLNRRDEVPNQELAAEIVTSGDPAAIKELVDNLSNKNKGIRNDCIKVLYEVGYVEPKLIADHTNTFLALLTSKDNRLQWGAMYALGCIVKEKQADIFAALPSIVAAADRGSVITRDGCVNILISLAAIDKYQPEAFPLLLKQMLNCPTNQLPMYAERALPIINVSNRDRFVQLLSSRLDEIGKETAKRRIVKVINRLK